MSLIIMIISDQLSIVISIMLRNILYPLLQPLHWNILHLLIKLFNRHIINLVFYLYIINVFLLHWNILNFSFRHPFNMFLVYWDKLTPGLFSWLLLMRMLIRNRLMLWILLKGMSRRVLLMRSRNRVLLIIIMTRRTIHLLPWRQFVSLIRRHY